MYEKPNRIDASGILICIKELFVFLCLKKGGGITDLFSFCFRLKLFRFGGAVVGLRGTGKSSNCEVV